MTSVIITIIICATVIYLVKSNNIHEKQIDELQMKLEPILEERESGIKVYEEAQDMYDDAILDALKDKDVDIVVEPASPSAEPTENIYTKTCRMDKEFAEEELDRTRKALDKAIWWLKEIVENHRYTPISTAEMALKEITALEQKD